MDISKLYTIYCRTYFSNVVGVDEPTVELVQVIRTEEDWAAAAVASEDYYRQNDLKTKPEFADRIAEMMQEPDEEEGDEAPAVE